MVWRKQKQRNSHRGRWNLHGGNYFSNLPDKENIFFQLFESPRIRAPELSRGFWDTVSFSPPSVFCPDFFLTFTLFRFFSSCFLKTHFMHPLVNSILTPQAHFNPSSPFRSPSSAAAAATGQRHPSVQATTASWCQTRHEPWNGPAWSQSNEAPAAAAYASSRCCAPRTAPTAGTVQANAAATRTGKFHFIQNSIPSAT